jgi:hypothetical protein
VATDRHLQLAQAGLVIHGHTLELHTLVVVVALA